MKKYLIFCCCILCFIFLVVWKKQVIIKKHNKKEISFFAQWEKKGKPVVIQKILNNTVEKKIEIPLIFTKEKILSYVPYETYKKIDADTKITIGDTLLNGKIQKTIEKNGLYTLSFYFSNIEKNFDSVIASLEEREEGVYIPQDSVINKQGIDYVFIVKDQKAYKKRITIKKEILDKYLVLGLNIGDHLVIRGQKMLKNKEKINEVGL